MTALDKIEELRTLVLVVEAGSLSAAARSLRVSPNAVSRRVMRLESQLGVKLFHRSTRALSVTHEGLLLYTRARRAILELDAAHDEIRDSKGALSGQVRVAIPGGASSPLVLERLAQLLDANPLLQLQLSLANEPVDPRAQPFDIVVRVGPVADSRLVARRLAVSSWALAATPSYLARAAPVRVPHDLRHHRCLRYASQQPQDHWPLVNKSGHVIKVPVGGGFEADDTRILGDACYAGLGIGVRPLAELQLAEREGRLAHVLPEWRFAALEVHALLPQGSLRVPRVAAVLAVLQEAFARLA
ncbi:MAG: LysR family transcriptional regulator [Rhizobacter sp.]